MSGEKPTWLNQVRQFHTEVKLGEGVTDPAAVGAALAAISEGMGEAEEISVVEGPRRVTRHSVTFSLQVSPEYRANTRDDLFYSLFSELGEGVKAVFPEKMSPWEVTTAGGFLISPLKVCVITFRRGADVPQGATVFDVTLAAAQEIPMRDAQCGEGFPFSVERLLAQVPGILLAYYESKGLPVSVLKVTFYKEYAQAAKGEYKV